MLTLAEMPSHGAYQYGLRPGENGWDIFVSPPDSDQWKPFRSTGSLANALIALDHYRKNPGWGSSGP